MAWGLGEIVGNQSGSRQVGLSASYPAGPLLVALTYVKQNDATGNDSTVKYNAAVNGATDKLFNAGIRHVF